MWHWLLGSILFLVIGVWLFLALLVKSPRFQSLIVHAVTKAISTGMNGNANIESVDIKFFKTMVLNNVLITDVKHDTILYAHKIEADISLFSIRKKTILVDEILLKQAKIALVRKGTDSLFNFQMLFPGSSNTTSKSDTTSSPAWLMSLRELDLEKVDFLYRDDLNKMFVKSRVPQLNLDIDKMDLQQLAFECASLSIVQPEVAIANGLIKPDDSIPFELLFPFELKLSSFELENGSFMYDHTQYENLINRFDPNHMDFKKINLLVNDLNISKDAIEANIEMLKLKDKNNFKLEIDHSLYSMNNQSMHLKQLHLKTNHTSIRSNISLYFKGFQYFDPTHKDFSFDVHTTQLNLDERDLRYFVSLPPLLNVQVVDFKGKASGKLSNMKMKNFSLKVNKSITLSGNLGAVGLPNMQEAVFETDSLVAHAAVQDIANLFPKTVVIPDLIKNMESFSYSGRFKGTIYKFVTSGNIQTPIGLIKTDIELQHGKENKIPVYKGRLQLTDFYLNKLLKDTLMGMTNLDLKIDGKGLNFDVLNSNIDGDIANFEYKGYNYKQIKINGQIAYKKFDGEINIKDEHANGFIIGKVDFFNTMPEYEFSANLKRLDLKALNIYNKPWVFSGLAKINMVGMKPDALNGEIDMDSLSVFDTEKNRKYQIDYLTLSLQNQENSRSITLYSDIAQAELQGKFSFSDLPKIANKYLISYFNKQTDLSDFKNSVELDFDISLENAKKIIPLFAPDFRNINLANISGKFNSRMRKMSIKADIRGLQYQKYSMANFTFSGHSEDHSFSFISNIDSVFQKDSLLLSPIVIAGNFLNDKLLYQLKVQKPGAQSRVNIKGQLTKEENGISLKFLPSEIIINNKKWNFDQRNKIQFTGKGINISNLIVFYKQEALKLYTANNDKNLMLEIKKVDLHDLLSNLLQNNHAYYGLVNGKIELKDFQDNPAPLVNLKIKQIVINKDSLGDLSIQSSWNGLQKVVNVKSNLIGKYQNLSIAGTYKVGDDIESPLNFNIHIKRFTPNFLDNYIYEYMYDIRGDLSGTLQLTGKIDKPVLTGFVNINSLETSVNYIHTRYSLKNQIARFSEKGISFDGISINDRYGNVSYGGGMIYHDHLTNFFLDIYIKTGRFECMNTTYANNSVFWGNLFGDVKFTMYGATDGIIDIKLKGKSIEGSELTLLLGNEKELEKYSFYTFKDKSPRVSESESRKRLFVKKSGVNIELDVDVANTSKLHIIFDPLAEDKINTEGNGNIKLKMKKNGEFNVIGEYKVDRGDYLFTFQNAIKRKFYIKSGGTMTFIGDPLKSQIDIEAVLRTRASPYDLVQTYIDQSNDELNNAAKIQTPLDLTLRLKNNLLKPDISFDITFLSYDSKLKTAFDNLSASMKNNENELNRQVFGILVLNRFMPPIYNPFPNNNLNSKDIQNTVTEYLSNQLSNYVSDWLSNFVTDVNFGVKYREYNQTDLSSQDLRRELQLSVSKKFANNRLSVNVGGNFDFGRKDNTKSQNFAGGDIELEYILTKDGNVRIKAFSKGQYDAFNSRSINRTGAGISYRQEFNDASELFRKIFKGGKK